MEEAIGQTLKLEFIQPYLTKILPKKFFLEK